MYATPKTVILSEPRLSKAKARRHEGSLHFASDDDAVRTTPYSGLSRSPFDRMYAPPKTVILSKPSLSHAKAWRHEGSLHFASDDDAVRTTPSLRSSKSQ